MSNQVFLSYRHENDTHRTRTRNLAERLESEGLEVVLDQFAQERDFHGGGPDEGWPRWSKSRAGDINKVLIIASTGWFKCYEMKEVPGSGLGAAAEAGIIEQRLYNKAGVNPDIRIVTFDPLDPLALPLDLQRYHRFADPADFTDLVQWLAGAAPIARASIGATEWPNDPPALLWPVANQSPVRLAFESLLTRTPSGRFLSLCGPTETGKSHLTRQMLGNALRMPDIACGRFDFKGTTDVETEVQAFVQHLNVPPLPDASTLIERLGWILEKLKQRAQPALLIFDTYEDAGDAQDWIEKQLLTGLIRTNWLRVVIAGQCVPSSSGTVWGAEACHPLQLESPPAEEWFAFSKPHKPDITLDYVRKTFGYCNGKASLLAQILGPA